MQTTVVITGATGGLGRLAALDLARKGAHVVAVARDPGKAERLRAEGGAGVEVLLADLGRLADVRRLAREITDRHGHVDVLVNNAGLHAFTSRTTPDGLPEMVAVNYLAPWLLTRELLPALRRAPAARVVTVASEAARRHGTLRLPEDLTETVPFTARGSSADYGRSKLLGIMFSLELARRLTGTGVTANCLNPGFNTTGLGRELRFAAPLEKLLTRLSIGDPARGAALIVALAADPAFAGRTGGYYSVPGARPIRPAPPADDPGLRARLWRETERLLDG
ncbi:SDR family NAD(P)-dependent oxidoreductase [Herbidospora sp. NEAU-GS84]|uniref:SDR family NAD(P)-dependent oxidoreductase n=1 Tax=Herbidospora solisilvae TaxID=2696284 RepID=A0A7C9IZY1_9ACTN|nr:SDR family NAD(P)-dependent oxidoreductase [Herbidospora solisilvae]NAS20267.1 SDR family NAD(P)-dependent oxidoreductase [Herbidospora solisilvae]